MHKYNYVTEALSLVTTTKTSYKTDLTLDTYTDTKYTKAVS